MRINGNLRWLLPAMALFLIVLLSKPLTHSIDFLVYYHAARVLITGQGVLYGPNSGIGFPQLFRYPPFFLLAFLPIALLPVKQALVLWLALKCAALFFVLRELAIHLGLPRSGWLWLIPFCVCGGFLVQEFRFGNAQFLIFALLVVALLNLRGRPIVSALALALAVSLKVWPLFFLPYMAARRHVRVAALTVAFMAGPTILPALYFGWQQNISLLRQWTGQEWGTGSLDKEAWFPSQSLGGVLQRYLTAMDFSSWPDPNYPRTNFAALDPQIVRGVWFLFTAFGYGGLLLVARATPGSHDALADGLALSLLPLLQPFTYRAEMVVLLWPGMLAGALMARRKILPTFTKLLFYAAILIEIAEPLFPGAQIQRFFQAIGVDFWSTALLASALLAVWLKSRREIFGAMSSRELVETSALPATSPSD